MDIKNMKAQRPAFIGLTHFANHFAKMVCLSRPRHAYHQAVAVHHCPAIPYHWLELLVFMIRSSINSIFNLHSSKDLYTPSLFDSAEIDPRSEASRVGKECVNRCRTRW